MNNCTLGMTVVDDINPIRSLKFYEIKRIESIESKKMCSGLSYNFFY